MTTPSCTTCDRLMNEAYWCPVCEIEAKKKVEEAITVLKMRGHTLNPVDRAVIVQALRILEKR